MPFSPRFKRKRIVGLRCLYGRKKSEEEEKKPNKSDFMPVVVCEQAKGISPPLSPGVRSWALKNEFDRGSDFIVEVPKT